MKTKTFLVIILFISAFYITAIAKEQIGAETSPNSTITNGAFTKTYKTDLNQGSIKTRTHHRYEYLKIVLIVFCIIFPLIIINSAFLKRQVKIKTAQFEDKNKLLNDQLQEMVRSKKKLIDSEQQFRRLFDKTTECIAIAEFVYDINGIPEDYVIIDANNAYLTTVGFDRDEVVGKKSLEIFPIETPPYFDIMLKTMNTNVPQKFETYLKHLDKHFSVQVFSPEQGQVATVIEDITSRKKNAAALEASEEKYRLLVENAHDAIIVVQDNHLKYSNPITLNLLNNKDSDINDILMTDLIHPDDLDMVLNAHIQRMAGIDVPNNYTFRGINCDGETLWLQINAAKFEWEGKPAILCVIRNISDEKKLESQLMQAQKMEAIGTLAGGIAHDFNNILSAIIGYTELGIMDVPTDSKVIGRLNRIFEASQRARDLVNQILNFSKQKDKELKPIRIKVIINEVLRLLRATMPSTITFATNLPKDIGIIKGDATQIHQVIMNLCTNAYHAMQETGGTLSVNLKNITIDKESSQYLFNIDPGEFVQLQISDTGHGMSKETSKRIFDPYFTTKKTGKGSGLGLSVVHGIVQSMNGDIKVYSEPDQGATVNIFFPSTETDIVIIENNVDDIETGTESILLVDDEAIIADMTSEVLQGLGYKVTTRVSSVEALQVFSNDPDRFDLIITDQTMPQKTGRELAIEILKIKPDIPIILCTGFSLSINEESAKTIGIKAFLNKPILKKHLAESIREVLDDAKVTSRS